MQENIHDLNVQVNTHTRTNKLTRANYIFIWFIFRISLLDTNGSISNAMHSLLMLTTTIPIQAILGPYNSEGEQRFSDTIIYTSICYILTCCMLMYSILSSSGSCDSAGRNVHGGTRPLLARRERRRFGGHERIPNPDPNISTCTESY